MTRAKSPKQSSRKKAKSKAVSCSFRQLSRALFPERSSKAKIEAWAKGKTDEEVFVAFLKILGFTKMKKNLPEFYKRQYLVEDQLDGNPNIRLYTMSGGPMIVFDRLGKFVEWC